MDYIPEENFIKLAEAIGKELAAKDAQIDVLQIDLGNMLDSNKQAEDEIERLREALKDIFEYWNGLNNQSATYDACVHNIEIAKQALEGK